MEFPGHSIDVDHIAAGSLAVTSLSIGGASVSSAPGTVYFVDGTSGVDAHSGLSWATAFLTIGQAVSTCSAGDTIAIKGTTFSEAVTCSKIGVKFVGVGTGPAQATWTAPTVAASFCLKMMANSILVENIKFKPVIYVTSGVPSAILLSGANYGIIRKCRFQGQAGSYTAIYSPTCDSDNVVIEGNEFLYMNTSGHGQAILGVEAGGLSYSGWVIKNNRFNSCIVDIDINGRACCLQGNIHPIGGIDSTGALGAITTTAIDLSGTSSGANTVTGCSLAGAYTSSLYTGGASQDNWAGNYAAITTTYCPNGITVPVKPA
jgi:hypothetical protein